MNVLVVFNKWKHQSGSCWRWEKTHKWQESKESGSGQCPSKCEYNRKRQWGDNRGSLSGSPRRVCLCSQITKCELPVFPMNTHEQDPAQCPHSTRENVNILGVYKGGVRRASDKLFIRLWSLTAQERKQVLVIIAGRSSFLWKQLQWRLFLKRPVHGHCWPAGRNRSLSFFGILKWGGFHIFIKLLMFQIQGVCGFYGWLCLCVLWMTWVICKYEDIDKLSNKNKQLDLLNRYIYTWNPKS